MHSVAPTPRVPYLFWPSPNDFLVKYELGIERSAQVISGFASLTMLQPMV
jgi:hypothetical protein